MAHSKRLTRRDVIKATISLPVLMGGSALVLSACGKKELVCTDTTGLAAADVQMRQMQEYVDASPFPDKNCTGCNFFNAPSAEGTCGTCKVLKGGVSPAGHCKLWVKKTG